MLILEIRCRQSKHLGQIMRKDKLENLVTTGQFDGKGRTERKRDKYLDGLLGQIAQ